MKNLRLKLTVLFVSVTLLHSFSQSKKLWITQGDKAFNTGDYTNAALYYAKALDDTTVLKTYVLPYETQMANQKFNTKKDSIKIAKAAIKANDTSRAADLKKLPKEDYALFQLAQSYRLNADFPNALVMYKKMVDRNTYPDARYYYALTLMNTRQYTGAMEQFEKFLATKPSTDSLVKVAKKKQSSCYFAMDSANVNRQIRIDFLDTAVFNKGNSSFAPAYFGSPTKLIFTSARKGNIITNPKKQDPEYLCDLFWTEFKDSAWTKAMNFGPSINTDQHEGPASVTPEDVFFFTRWNDEHPKEAFIYRAKMQNGNFFQALKLNENVNVPGYKSVHPCISSDGKRLYFSSNRPGGKGGFDIWVCNIDESGMVFAPQNLGEAVNTPGDEVTPFFHEVSSTLFFSSNGHVGMGGLDIFKSEFNPDNSTYGVPRNLNPPMNSSKDDSYFIMEKTQGRGFFTSDRVECPGGNCYKIFEFINQPIRFSIEGLVFDAGTNDPLAGALITVIETHGNQEPQFIVSDDAGAYTAELRGACEYFIKAQKNTYFGDAASISTKEKTASETFQQDFFLSTIPKGEIEIEGIEYDFNSVTLRPKGMENLDKIVDLLKLNDNLSVEINANTDSRGNDKYNMKLSQGRAQSCVDYLISKGIESARLIPKGWGESKPLITEAEINKMKAKSPEWEAAHQKNRRTSLVVVGESKINIINKGQ